MIANFPDHAPIISCSSGSSQNVAISIVRISGFEKLEDFSGLISKINLKHRVATLVDILENSQVVDNVIATFFECPRSYTGENLLELAVHGNKLNVQRVTNLFVKEGRARPAGPGEFSYRAFSNKKLSLAQIESLDLFLNANSKMVLKNSIKGVMGDLQKSYDLLYDKYRKVRSTVEILTDFSDDVGEEISWKLYHSSIKEIKNFVSSLSRRTTVDTSQLTSPSVVLFGETNAGKSSLLNALLNEDRAIVSDTPGTTRDYISEYISLNGTTFRLVDTAGIRSADNDIESLGILKSFERFENAFLKIFVFNPKENSLEFLKTHNVSAVVITHIDELTKEELDKIKLEISVPIFELNLLENELNLNLLLDFFKDSYEILFKDDPILLERHRQLINALNIKLDTLCDGEDIAIISFEINEIGRLVSELIGVVHPDELLNDIFDNFCIGK